MAHALTSFTPVSAIIGGVLIGIATATLFYFNGRLAGISGIVGGAVHPQQGEFGWRAWFIGGLLAGGAVLYAIAPTTFGATGSTSIGMLSLAGVLVGFGTRLANGCTSGHGVCGIARLSPRSFVATGTFMMVAAIVVFVTTHWLRGGA